MSLTTRDLVLRHWQLANAQDWEGLGRLLQPELLYEAPQSRERIRSAPPMMGLTRFDVKDGRIARVTDCWPDPCEPGPRMSTHVQRY